MRMILLKFSSSSPQKKINHKKQKKVLRNDHKEEEYKQRIHTKNTYKEYIEAIDQNPRDESLVRFVAALSTHGVWVWHI